MFTCFNVSFVSFSPSSTGAKGLIFFPFFAATALTAICFKSSRFSFLRSGLISKIPVFALSLASLLIFFLSTNSHFTSPSASKLSLVTVSPKRFTAILSFKSMICPVYAVISLSSTTLVKSALTVTLSLKVFPLETFPIICVFPAFLSVKSNDTVH